MKNWHLWATSDDLPQELRKSIRRGAGGALLNPEECEKFRQIILGTFSEALEIYLENNELKWRCEEASRLHPEFPREAIFRAISIEVGVSVSRLRELWFTSRRKARVKQLIRQASNSPTCRGDP